MGTSQPETFFRAPAENNLLNILMEMLQPRQDNKESPSRPLQKSESTPEKKSTHGEENTKTPEATGQPEENDNTETEKEAVTTMATISAESGEQARVKRPAPFLKSPHPGWAIAATLVLLAVIGLLLFKYAVPVKSSEPKADAQTAENTRPADPNVVTLDEGQIHSVKIVEVSPQPFREEKIATGKIGFNEDVMTPIFSPYTGRVTRLFVKPGDNMKKGAPLFEIETPDLVQAETDLISANLALAKAKSAADLARRAEDRQHILYANKAAALKDWEQAEADLHAAERDVHSQEAALAAARDRLHTFGKTDAEIAKIETDRQLDRMTKVFSPISGTITARKVGLGQYVKPDNPDPLFTIADLSSVWLLADVYESDIPLMKIGEPVQVRVNAFPNEVFTARISYIGASLDPTTHRIPVRSVVENRGQKLKPDMFANFRIATNSQIQAPAVPAIAIVRDGDKDAVWVADKNNQFVRREVVVGLEQNGYRQIISGLQTGDKVVSEGSLLLSNAASL